MSHMWASHVPTVNASCRMPHEKFQEHTTRRFLGVYEWCMNVTCRTRECDMLHTRVNESSHTYDWVMSHIWMHHITRKKSFCHASGCVTFHLYKKKTSCHTCEWATYMTMCGVSHTYVRVLSHTSIHRVTNMHATCHVHVPCARTPNQSIFWRHTHLSHATHVHESCDAGEWVMSHIWMRHITRMSLIHEWGVAHIWMRPAMLHTHAYTHTYAHMHVTHIGLEVDGIFALTQHKFACVCVWYNSSLHIYIHIDIYANTYGCICIYIYLYTYVCIYVYIYTHSFSRLCVWHESSLNCTHQE